MMFRSLAVSTALGLLVVGCGGNDQTSSSGTTPSDRSTATAVSPVHTVSFDDLVTGEEMLIAGEPTKVDISGHCGFAVLGPFNSTWWHAAEAAEGGDWYPDEWDSPEIRADAPVALILQMSPGEDQLHVTYRGFAVEYTPGSPPAAGEFCA